MKTRIIKVNIALLMAVAFSLTTIGPALADSLELGNTVTTGDTFINGGDTTLGVAGAGGQAGTINLVGNEATPANHTLTVSSGGVLFFDGADINGAVTLAGEVTGSAGANVVADNVIDSANIINGTIVTGDIAADTILAGNLAADSVEASELADDSVASANVIDDSLVNADINSAAAISASKLADDEIDDEEIADNSLTAASLATGSVASDEILNGTIVDADISANSLTAAVLATGSVASDEIVDGTIVTGDIAADTILAGNLAADSVEASELADDSVASANIIDNTIGADDITETGVAANIKSFARYIPTATEPTSASVANAANFTYDTTNTTETETMVMLPFTSPVLYFDLINAQVLGDGAPAALSSASGAPTSIAGGALTAYFDDSSDGIVVITNNAGSTLEMTLVPVAYD